ncbi:hypothetical protein GCM10007876_40820 [Litoribrevibacter albus]|uniref:Uncharacterized protein n=1 Tax=Litoribrevibacter albus TaxID=1473156 RepID=A0AA37SFH6_9GAMM|nr:hypothetical protein GCM10007876_40820 [Litoribrevibacter albus]
MSRENQKTAAEEFAITQRKSEQRIKVFGYTLLVIIFSALIYGYLSCLDTFGEDAGCSSIFRVVALFFKAFS